MADGFWQRLRRRMTASVGFRRGENIPRLETPRLILRQMTPDDAADMYEYSCREEVTRYLLWDPHPSQAYTREYLEALQERYRSGTYYDWGLQSVDTGRLIGTCCFTNLDMDNRCGEIGYVVHPDYWFLGIAAEAASCVIAYGFLKLHLNRIEARYIIGNEVSRSVMEKCGMTFEGIYRRSVLVKGAYRDVGVCSILRNEYFDPQHN